MGFCGYCLFSISFKTMSLEYLIHFSFCKKGCRWGFGSNHWVTSHYMQSASHRCCFEKEGQLFPLHEAASICAKKVPLPGGHSPRQVWAPLRCSPPATTLVGGDSGRESLTFSDSSPFLVASGGNWRMLCRREGLGKQVLVHDDAPSTSGQRNGYYVRLKDISQEFIFPFLPQIPRRPLADTMKQAIMQHIQGKLTEF